MKKKALEALSEKLDRAAVDGVAVDMLTTEHEITLDEAYAIQRGIIARHEKRGDPIVGRKMGFTSVAKMEQMGVHEPIHGLLTQSMRLPDGGKLDIAGLVAPRVEPEIAFVMASELAGPISAAEAMRAVRWVVPALEVLDSRYRNFKFTLEDVVADNTSACRFVLGSHGVAPDELDLGNLGMVMEIDGEVVGVGSSAAILDHPARSLAALAGMLAKTEEVVPEGSVVLAGGATKAVHLSSGQHVRLSVDVLGTVEFSVA